jgi:transposase
MGIDYTEVIVESGAQLGRCERRLRGQAKGARVRMLRLLKGGQATSLPACVPLVGYSLRQLRRWWAEYKESGLVGLIEEKPHPGKASKLSDAAYEALQVQMRLGKIATLEDARGYLAREHSIEYGSVNGVWWQLRKHKAKPKTGRRAHRRSDQGIREAFKSGLC